MIDRIWTTYLLLTLVCTFVACDESYQVTKEEYDIKTLVEQNTIGQSVDLSRKHITYIGDTAFDNLFDLQSINLSLNFISQISYTAFISLFKLSYLDLSHNRLTQLYFESFSLSNLATLNASHNNITELSRIVFQSLLDLTELDLSYNAINVIEFDVFSGLRSLKSINISNNHLDTFNIDMSSTLLTLRHIDLSNNKIKLNSGMEFSNFPFLETLYLHNNDVSEINSRTFQNSKTLIILDLSSNPRLKIAESPFRSLTYLRELSLNNVRTKFSFENYFNILKLSANNCSVENMNSLHLSDSSDIVFLNLSLNEITAIDKYSFEYYFNLKTLDLSFNKIMYIQPGSFIATEYLNYLNLQGNQLSNLQFGVFYGIKSLMVLDLSNNSLYSFDAQLLPNVSNLYLDNNMLSLNIEDFFDTKYNLTTLSVGSNQIPCKALIELNKDLAKREKFIEIVKASVYDYYIENLNGISCHSVPNIQLNVIPVSKMNNFSALFNSTMNHLYKSMHAIVGNNTKFGDKLWNELRNMKEVISDLYSNITIADQEGCTGSVGSDTTTETYTRNFLTDRNYILGIH